jgi:hypothetical protein
VILPFTAVPFLLPRDTQVTIVSTPPGATVLLDGQARGNTPLALSLPRPLQGALHVELAGYVAQTGVLKPGLDTVSFALQPVPRPPEPVPAEALPPEAPQEPEPVPVARKSARKPPAKKPRDVFDQVRQP